MEGKALDASVEPAASETNNGIESYATSYPDASTMENQSRLRRIFNLTQLLAFALTFMSSWEVVLMNMGATFANGGPRALVWGCLLVIVGSLAQAMSLAEMGSILPLAGAQYHWTHMMAPPSKRRFITWMQGWVTWFAWVSALGGSTSGEAFILQGLISENMSGYSAERWHLTLIMIGLLVTTGLINTFAFRAVPWLELISGIMHVILFFIFAGVIGALGQRNSAEFALLDSTTSSGWAIPYVAFNIGMLVPAWGFIGFDGVNHMSEEVRKAKEAVPRAMVLTILINGVLAFTIALVVVFYMGNPADALESGYPIIPILRNLAGPKAMNAMVSSLVLITYCVITASMASVGRITWAWARDGALPKYFAYVDPKFHVPIRAIWLPVVIVSLLSLLNIGSTASTAFSAFTSLSSLGLYTSYVVNISCILYARVTGDYGDGPNARVRFGGWKMWNGCGFVVNVYALLWTAYLTVFLPFPTSRPVASTNMNYSLPIYAFVVVCALTGWVAWGKKSWKGLNMSIIIHTQEKNE